MTLLSLHLFLKEYGLTLIGFLLALVVICFLIDRATRYHEQDLIDAQRKYSRGEFNG